MNSRRSFLKGVFATAAIAPAAILLSKEDPWENKIKGDGYTIFPDIECKEKYMDLELCSGDTIRVRVEDMNGIEGLPSTPEQLS